MGGHGTVRIRFSHPSKLLYVYLAIPNNRAKDFQFRGGGQKAMTERIRRFNPAPPASGINGSSTFIPPPVHTALPVGPSGPDPTSFA